MVGLMGKYKQNVYQYNMNKNYLVLNKGNDYNYQPNRKLYTEPSPHFCASRLDAPSILIKYHISCQQII